MAAGPGQAHGQGHTLGVGDVDRVPVAVEGRHVAPRARVRCKRYFSARGPIHDYPRFDHGSTGGCTRDLDQRSPDTMAVLEGRTQPSLWKFRIASLGALALKLPFCLVKIGGFQCEAPRSNAPVAQVHADLRVVRVISLPKAGNFALAAVEHRKETSAVLPLPPVLLRFGALHTVTVARTQTTKNGASRNILSMRRFKCLADVAKWQTQRT